jgi:hypothetical protein
MPVSLCPESLIHPQTECRFRNSSPSVDVAAMQSSCREYRRDAPPAIGVVLSYAVHGKHTEVNMVVKNGLEYATSAFLIVHLSKENRAMNRSLSLRHERIIVNQEHTAVRTNTPTVLAAHLSNFAACELTGNPCSAIGGDALQFVFMPANALLFRPGFDRWILQHSMSWCTDQTCADIVIESQENVECRGCLVGWEAALDRLSSRAYKRMQARGYREDDRQSYLHTSSLIHFGALIRAGEVGNAMWRQSPIASFPHEGSFYPVHILRAFSRCGLPSSRFGGALQNGSLLACIDMYQHANATRNARYNGVYMGGCDFEEHLLPTFVWQHYGHLLPAASPPIIARLWISVNNALAYSGANRTANRSASNMAAFGWHLLSHPQQYGHIFGLKAPKQPASMMSNAMSPFRVPPPHAPRDRGV